MYKKMKITKYLTMLAAVVGMTAACQKEEFVTFNPDNVVAPVLHAVEDIVVTVDNKSEAVTFTWDAADFGVKTQIYYSLDMAKGDKVVNLFTGVSGTSMNVSMDNINNKAFNDLEIPSGEAGEVVFTLSAKLNVGASYAAAPVKAMVTPTAAEKEYAKMWVVGSYNGWAHDASNQFLFNFAEDGVAYTGVVDFGEDHSANEFKITGGGWGNDEHSATGTNAEEAATVTMVAGGGDNVAAYKAKRYYHLTFDKSAPSLSKNYSFDQVGIIGLNGDWENDIVMTFSKSKQRFYADIEVPAATEMKFRMDADWGVNFGGDMKALSNGGDNIKIEAGNYRVYFNMNNLSAVTCVLDAKMYGQEEEVAGPVEPEPPVDEPAASGWALIGDFNGWGGDLAMTQAGVIWSATNVELVAGQGFKLRKDGGWDVNRGAAGDVEPFVVPLGEGFEAVAGGKNLTVPADGAYDIYYDEGNEEIFVLATGSEKPVFAPTWFLVGGFNGWTVADMAYKLSKEGDYYVFKGFVLDAENEVKFNAGGWDVNRGADSFSADAAIDVVQDGSNLKVPAGTYDVYMTLDASKAYFMTEGKTPADAGEAVVTYVDASTVVVGFSGNFGGIEAWTDPADSRLAVFASKEVTDEATYAGTYTFEVPSIVISENDQFKVRVDGKWIGAGEGGATVEGLAVTGEDNFIAGESGIYKVTISFDWDGLAPSNVKAVFAK